MTQPDAGKRKLLLTLAATAVSGSVPGLSPASVDPVLTRKIPSSGELVPVVGMGSARTFNVGSDPALRDARCQVLHRFFDMGGMVIDSSPMYGSSEAVIGHCLEQLDVGRQLFAATKVWTPFASSGKTQIEESQRLWGVPRLDLQQVHNLVSWKKHLVTLNEMKAAGQLRYVGITTSHGRRHAEMEDIMRGHRLDFVQLSYNVVDREVEERLLPLAQDRGMGVIVNRPFQRGALFDRFAHIELPPWAGDFDCSNWAQFFLKFIVSHPAVTCAIPATTQVAHMVENMGALKGRLPDQRERQRMVDYIKDHS